MSYTSQTASDVKVIEGVLSKYAGKPVRFLEIGTYAGDTSREIKKFCEGIGATLEFWGIDSGTHPSFRNGISPPIPFVGANMVFGDSAEVFHLIPDKIDVVLVDGCHCFNHVILDTVHYGKKVVVGGCMLFHDTSPHIQQTMKDPHGPDIEEFHNSVVAAHDAIGFPWSQWSRRNYPYDPVSPWGGITGFVKTK